MNTNTPHLVVISAPSGTGKTTVARALLASNNNIGALWVALAPSKRREGENEGWKRRRERGERRGGKGRGRRKGEKKRRGGKRRKGSVGGDGTLINFWNPIQS